MRKISMRFGAGAWVTALMGMLLAAAIAAPAQTFETLLNLNGTDGEGPTYGSLVQGIDGNLYGTTAFGGNYTNCTLGCGTVFKITAEGKLTTLYNFCSQSGCTDGSEPNAGLVLDAAGNFYGTTNAGGLNYSYCPSGGCGTIFKVTPGGKLTTLYKFCTQAGCTDGLDLFAGLVLAANGNFYGTATYGGTKGYGTVFEITATGKLTVLYSFCAQPNCADGTYPRGALVQATDGNFYGTAGGGGLGYGTVFKITPAGTLTTLHSFDVTDGDGPWGGLVQATNGNFYGTTQQGGSHGFGTVFEITPARILTTLHSFDATDGEYPEAALVQSTDGNFYGTTYQGGTSSDCSGGCGTAFKITAGGKLTTLHSFDGTDGSALYGLVQATNGSFYGTTFEGGVSSICPYGLGCGTVFSLGLGLKPFVEALPTVGKIGAAIKILGNNLTGATIVTFNSTPATFTVISATEIATTVPASATTGPVQVVTPSGTLTCNVNFRVE